MVASTRKVSGYIGLCLASGEAYKGLLALVGIELVRPAEAHTAFPGPLAALSCAAADKLALELREAAQNRQHQAPMRRRGVGPYVLERAEANKGKLIGAKPPLRPKHVWSIRTKLQIADRKRDLAMFKLAIDSKLRGCDVVALKVEDIAPHGYAIERATVRQKKTGVPVRFEVTEQSRQAVDDYIRS